MSVALRVAPISQHWSDAELVAAVRGGNDSAFEELYSRYGRRICSYVHGMVGDHGRAEDITQEIFMAAHRRMRATERPIAFKAWIYEIAKNACIDSYRRTRRAQEVSLDADDDLSSADRGRLTAVTTPDAAIDTKQSLNDLRGAFVGLSDSHHEILVLREFEGRSYSDIAKRLGMSLPVVESTLFRARRRLAEEYDELASGRRCELVRKMVDSGPQYSLGIRDRRRVARHFAHCQSCRTHARRAGFDESILSMPRVRAKIAALLPIPLLRVRSGADRVVNAGHGRSSGLALRSAHTLARSADQIVGASPVAGRGAATAAALVLASVGGGIAVTSSQPLRPLHGSGAGVSASSSSGGTWGRTSNRGPTSARSVDLALARSPRSKTPTAGSGSAAAAGGADRATAGAAAGAPNAVAAPVGGNPVGSGVAGAPAGPVAVPLAAGSSGAPAASGVSGAGTPIASGVGGAGGPVTAGTGTGAVPSVPATGGAAGAGAPTGTLTGGLPAGVPPSLQVPGLPGASLTALAGSAASASPPPVAPIVGQVGAVAGALGQTATGTGGG